MRYLVPLGFLLASTTCVAAADFGGPSYDGSLKDGPVPAVYNWSGIYIGGHAGWMTGGWDGNMSLEGAENDPNMDHSGKSLDDDSWLGGLQGGFNIQRGAIVLGAEADISWADFGSGDTFDPYPPPHTSSALWHFTSNLDYFGTVRGRLGFLPSPRLLLYATGGFAWAKTNMDQVVTHANVQDPTATGSASETHTGWTAGVGGEFMLANNWTIRAEWLHIALGEEDYKTTGWNNILDKAHTTDAFPADLTFDVFRLGVNYKFGN